MTGAGLRRSERRDSELYACTFSAYWTWVLGLLARSSDIFRHVPSRYAARSLAQTYLTQRTLAGSKTCRTRSRTSGVRARRTPRTPRCAASESTRAWAERAARCASPRNAQRDPHLQNQIGSLPGVPLGLRGCVAIQLKNLCGSVAFWCGHVLRSSLSPSLRVG